VTFREEKLLIFQWQHGGGASSTVNRILYSISCNKTLIRVVDYIMMNTEGEKAFFTTLLSKFTLKKTKPFTFVFLIISSHHKR